MAHPSGHNSPTTTPTSPSLHLSDLIPIIRHFSPAASPSASDSEGDNRQTRKKKTRKHHRTFSPFGLLYKKDDDQPKVSLDWLVETPPVMFHDDASRSAGALFTGMMHLDVEETVQVDSFQASLQLHVHQKRPFAKHCTECSDQYTELKHWDFLPKAVTLTPGRHAYPFSIHLRGHNPESIDTPVVAVSYEFKAQIHCAGFHPLSFERDIPVKRALLGSDPLHQSMRVFPPTNVKATVFLNRVIHPSGTHKVQLRLDGITSLEGKRLEIWKLKRLAWKLEETVCTTAPVCSRHAAEGASTDQLTVRRNEARILGGKEMHGGWKSDYNTSDARVEFEFEYGLTTRHTRKGDAMYACDVRAAADGTGTEISHSLSIEMLLSKELASSDIPNLVLATSDARVLRMRHAVILTEAPGLGVAWDAELPPVYDDVPPSPPSYPKDAAIEYENLEVLDEQERRPSVGNSETSLPSA
ncbi:hypothetical protein HYQ45_001037 [Verticillium longisporum]|uniref:LDB19 N-terminal domain-containing protein n=1 Tax=Verticillium longisporum TaxID=100787 RepID=A0A8I3A031_VERLO|nr:hypothetical protein HYQ45_001037 [Verticillium longisporum]